MHLKSGTIEIMLNDKADGVIKEFLNCYKIDVKIIWKNI